MSMITYLRSFRIFHIAMFDLISAFLGMILLAIMLQKYFFPNYDRNKFIIVAIILTIPTGIFFHYIFGISTTLNRKLTFR